MTGREGAEGAAEGLLGPLEYAVMQALWQEAPANVGAVRDRINDARAHGDELAYTTVMTVLSRLHEKGVAERVKVGRGYDYAPRFSEEALVEHLGRQEITGLLDRYGDVALAQFAAVLRDADPKLLARLDDIAASDHDA